MKGSRKKKKEDARYFSNRVLGMDRVGAEFRLVLLDTYLEHGGGFVVPVLSAIAVLGRTTRNVKSAACTRGRNIETEHVGTMAIFFALFLSLSVSYYYTCVRGTIFSFYPFLFLNAVSRPK